MQRNCSEVACLLRQIEAEHEAALLGVHGLAAGTSQHRTITARMERMGACADQLAATVGRQEAGRMMAEALVVYPDEANPLPC